LHAVLGLFLSIAILMNRPNPANWGRADWVEAALLVGALVGLLTLHHAPGWAAMWFRVRELRREREEVLRWRAELANAETSALLSVAA
jgi:hypothetical protein